MKLYLNIGDIGLEYRRYQKVKSTEIESLFGRLIFNVSQGDLGFRGE